MATHVILNNNERAATGFTDLFEVNYDEFTSAVNDADESITLMGLVAGDMVDQRLLLEVETNWGGLTTANGLVGVTSNTDRLMGSTNLLAAGGEYYAEAGDAANSYVATSAVNLLFTLDPGANTEACADSTAGKVRIWLNIQRRADRQNIEF